MCIYSDWKIDVKHWKICIFPDDFATFSSRRCGDFERMQMFISITKDANKLIYSSLMIFCFFNHLFRRQKFIISIMSVRLFRAFFLVSDTTLNLAHSLLFHFAFSHVSYLKFSILLKNNGAGDSGQKTRHINEWHFQNICIWMFTR